MKRKGQQKKSCNPRLKEKIQQGEIHPQTGKYMESTITSTGHGSAFWGETKLEACLCGLE